MENNQIPFAENTSLNEEQLDSLRREKDSVHRRISSMKNKYVPFAENRSLNEEQIGFFAENRSPNKEQL